MLPFAGISCLGFTLVILGLALLGRWILKPMAEASRWVQAPRRFFLSDFVWLMVLLQAAFAGVALVPSDERGLFIILLIFSVGAAIAVWAAATSTLSRSGIVQARRRGVFILVLMPGVLVVLVASAMWVFALLAGIEAIRSRERGSWLAVVIGGFLGIVLAAWALRWTTRWIVAGAEAVELATKEAARQAEREQRSPWDD